MADRACAGVGSSVVVFLSVGGKPSMNVFLDAELVSRVKTRKRQAVGTPMDGTDGGVAPVVFVVVAVEQMVSSMLLSKCLSWSAANYHVIQEEVVGILNVREERQGSLGDLIRIIFRWWGTVLVGFGVVVRHLWMQTLGNSDKVGDDVVMRDQGVGVVPRGTVDYFGEGDGRVGYVDCTNIVKVGVGYGREAIVGSPEAELCLIVAMIRGEGVGHCPLQEREVVRGVGDRPVCSPLVNVEAGGNGD